MKGGAAALFVFCDLRHQGCPSEDLSMPDRILVTGATGFIAKHCIKLALARGYDVRGTARRPGAAAAVRAAVGAPGGRLEIVLADLTRDEGWADAVRDCRFVLHTASPLPLRPPRNAEDLVRPARDGTLRVLKAAAGANVERTVVTSSTAAVISGREQPRDHVFSEADWSDAKGPIGAYPLSKTLAERAAWDFIAGDGSGMSLAVINPSAVLGPALDADLSISALAVSSLLRGRIPAVPPLSLTIVDVRDVAEAHLRAMERPEAGGERIIATSGPLWMKEIGEILRRHFPQYARRIPRREIPAGLLRLVGRLVPPMRPHLRDLDVKRRTSNEKARRLLGLTFRTPEEAVVAMGSSLIALGLVR
jgi:dihydroflavonol-4-reductase